MRSEERSEIRTVRSMIETVAENNAGSDRVAAISTVVREFYKNRRTEADSKADWQDEYLKACLADDQTKLDNLRKMGQEFGYIQ